MKIKDKNNIPKLLKELEYLNNHKLVIGILSEQQSSEILMIASVHEFGTDIRVTPKMRAYLHSIGIHLRADTDEIKIPERSYLRATIDQKKDEIDKTTVKLLDGVFNLRISARVMLETIGGMVVSLMQEFLTDLSEPANHPVTVERKGSSNPLIDTGQLRSAITFKIERR